ncbi:MAG TPA: HigA family addiction module antitoxin [Acidobacteriaceae bacterium]
MMTMKDPPHPGLLLKHDVFEPLGMDITEASRRLGMARVSLSRVVNGRSGISPDLAIRLEKAGVSTARFWLALQTTYDLSRAQRRKQPKVVPFKWSSAEAA